MTADDLRDKPFRFGTNDGVRCARCGDPAGDCLCRRTDPFPHCFYRQRGEPCPLGWHAHPAHPTISISRTDQ